MEANLLKYSQEITPDPINSLSVYQATN